MIQNKTQENLSSRRTATIRVAVTVRLPEAVVDKIDSDLDSRAIPMSRNNWLLEAAIEKLQRERKRGSNGTQ